MSLLNEINLDGFKPGRFASTTPIHSNFSSTQYQVTTCGLHRFRRNVIHNYGKDMCHTNIVFSYFFCNIWDFLVKSGFIYGNHISSGRQLNDRNSTAKVSGYFPGRVLNCRRISTVFTVTVFAGEISLKFPKFESRLPVQKIEKKNNTVKTVEIRRQNCTRPRPHGLTVWLS